MQTLAENAIDPGSTEPVPQSTDMAGWNDYEYSICQQNSNTHGQQHNNHEQMQVRPQSTAP